MSGLDNNIVRWAFNVLPRQCNRRSMTFICTYINASQAWISCLVSICKLSVLPLAIKEKKHTFAMQLFNPNNWKAEYRGLPNLGWVLPCMHFLCTPMGRLTELPYFTYMLYLFRVKNSTRRLVVCVPVCHFHLPNDRPSTLLWGPQWGSYEKCSFYHKRTLQTVRCYYTTEIHTLPH